MKNAKALQRLISGDKAQHHCGKINANQHDRRLALAQTTGNEIAQAQRFFGGFTV
ncbi:hypothetical protein [Dentiradicibacter hellwigii]|jgi:hypothetical protein|uniref:Uncharacterized protein n=1 Tax=Dentiradicibacter hellwigii TaxID=3149053 RepID=A0ABV4UDD0_9RHOO